MHPLLQKLGLESPIIQAPMAGVSTPEMAAAVSNAGGLGSIGVGAVNAETTREMIAATRAITSRPFQVNVFCHRPAVANAAREAAWLTRLRPEFARHKQRQLSMPTVLGSANFGLLDYWNTVAQLDSMFQKSRSLSQVLSRKAWKTRRIRAARVPKILEFAPHG